MKGSLAEWRAQGKVRRLWGRDASLWSGRDEAQWLGWLGITNGQLAHIERLTSIRDAARNAGFSHVLLLGMGGSSLGPEVIKTTFGRISGFPGALRARFDRSGSGEGHREQSRSEEHALHRLEQVGLNPRAQRLQTVLLRPYRTARRPEGSRQALPRHHRSGLKDAAGRRTRRLSARLPRLAEHRRALFGSLGFRPGPGGHHGRGCGKAPGPDRGDGVCLHAVRSGCRESRSRARHHPRHGSAGIRPRQVDDRRRRPGFPVSVPGWSSWWRS